MKYSEHERCIMHVQSYILIRNVLAVTSIILDAFFSDFLPTVHEKAISIEIYMKIYYKLLLGKCYFFI